VAGNDGRALGLVVNLSDIDRGDDALSGKAPRRLPGVVVGMCEILAEVNLVPIGLEGPAVDDIAADFAEVVCAVVKRKDGGGGETEGESK
jgi:hypothetical protein